MGFEKFFHDQIQNYLDKLNMMGLNSLDITCKNERAIFTRWISFTGTCLVINLQNHQTNKQIAWARKTAVKGVIISGKSRF